MPSARRLAALAALTSSLAAVPALAQPARFYDPTVLLGALRAPARATLAQAAGVARVEDLTLYDLQLSLDDAGRAFTLREEVWFTNTTNAALPEVVFRVYGNASRPSPQGGAQGAPTTPAVRPVTFVRGDCPTGPCTVTGEAPSVIAVRPATPVAPGGRLRVRFELRGELPQIDPSRTNIMAQGMESLSALGASESSGDYGLLATGDGITSLANFYPVVARRRGAGWERADASAMGDLGSDDLANYHAVIETAPGTTVATTGVAIRSATSAATPGAPSRQRVEVGAAGVRDFAVMAGRTLQVATRRVGDVEVRSYFLPAERAAGERVLDTAAHALAVFERRFGSYPYVDLDVVEAPLVGGAGGVEFPGLVTVASMFYRPPQSTGLLAMLGGGEAMNRMLPSILEFTTAHEVAHQYWHALVGSDSREHPFVDEGLAQWSAALYLEDRHGAARARRDADMQVRMNYQFMRLLGHPDAAVDRPAAAFGSPIAYAGLVYGKGPYFYNALRSAVGDAVFFRALRRYVSTYRFRSAPPSGFTDALIAEAPRQSARVRALARRWLQETHGDEDLGQADFGAMMAQMMGGDSGQVTPEMQSLLQMLGPMLQGLGGGASAPGAAPRSTPGSSNTQRPDALLQQLQQALEGVNP